MKFVVAFTPGRNEVDITVSKEVKKHLDVREIGIAHADLDGNSLPAPICPLLLKPPFVCNPCRKKYARCKYTKQFYHANVAHEEYQKL